MSELTKIFKAKRRRRRELAALPIDEKIRTVEQLQDLAKELIEARKTLNPRRPSS